MNQSILQYDTVALTPTEDAIRIIDQTELPAQLVFLDLYTQPEIWRAIQRLQVRGAPAIGVTAAYGLYLASREIETTDPAEFRARLHTAADYLASSRPTAVNLRWALNRMETAVSALPTVSAIRAALLRESHAIHDEDIRVCQKIGEYGLELVQPGWGLLTHCNAGQLATVKYGTATAPIYLGQQRGYHFRVFADETRPLLQGARLTASELSAAGVDVTLICDNMAATVMKRGWIQAVFVGCDRVAANGDAANKIGTLGVAVLAKRFGIPFYICAPSSTIDLDTPTGAEIPIEERDGTEISHMWYAKPMAADGVKTFNPAFDVTDADLISGIVTEYGVARPPYTTSIPELFRRKAAHPL
jgi:methylthioribose-1-phosphate isomerase